MRWSRFGVWFGVLGFAIGCSSDGGSDGKSGGCTVGAGQCANVCAGGTAADGEPCLDGNACQCGLRCVDSCEPTDGRCPNVCTSGTGVAGETCSGPEDCVCGLFCKDGSCAPYEAPFAGCACAGGYCAPVVEACTCNASGPLCVPNTTLECLCVGGGTGVQSCLDDGSGYTPCAGCGDVSQPDVGQPDAGASDTGDAPAPPSDAGGECTEKYSKTCDGETVIWLDSCGNKGAVYEICTGGAVCQFGECTDVCLPHDNKSCHNGNVFWFDSCGNAESVVEVCAPSDFCEADFCLKASFDGTWHLTADPPKKTLPGFGTATFFEQDMVLTIDGTTATAEFTFSSPPTIYSGTLVGKTLKISSQYTEEGVPPFDHDTEMTVEFTSPTEFHGVEIDNLATTGFPVGKLIWDVTGIKK